MDLEAPLHISELNSAIPLLSLKNGIALFSSEMCRDASKSTSHPQTMIIVSPHTGDFLLLQSSETFTRPELTRNTESGKIQGCHPPIGDFVAP